MLILIGFSVNLLATGFFLLFERMQYDPRLSRLASSLGLDPQQVVGREVRIPIARKGPYLDGRDDQRVKRRMPIDSGGTITALSEDTARRAGMASSGGLSGVMLQTASGFAIARTAIVDEIRSAVSRREG